MEDVRVGLGSQGGLAKVSEGRTGGSERQGASRLTYAVNQEYVTHDWLVQALSGRRGEVCWMETVLRLYFTLFYLFICSSIYLLLLFFCVCADLGVQQQESFTYYSVCFILFFVSFSPSPYDRPLNFFFFTCFIYYVFIIYFIFYLLFMCEFRS